MSTNTQVPVAAIRPPLRVSGLRAAASAVGLDESTAIYSMPFLVALAYLFVDFARPQDWIPPIGLIRPGMLALGTGMVVVLSRRAFPNDRLTRYMLAFLVLMAVSVPFAENRNRAFYGTQSFALLLFGGLAPLIAFVDTFPRLQHLMRFWVAVNLSCALYVLKNGGVGVGSFLTDENDVALAMNMALPYAVALAVLEQKLILRLFAVGATLVILFASVRTLSRGGFIGLAFMGLIIWLQSRRKFASMAVIIVLVGAVLAFAPSKYWSDIRSIKDADKKGDTGFQRIYSWSVAWRIYQDYPVFGVGPNNYPYTAWKYETEVSDQIGYHLYGRAAHSLYFTILPELGTVGCVIFFGMVLHGIRERYRLRRHARETMIRDDLSDEARTRAKWMRQLTVCLDASLAGFLGSGAFLSVLYYPHVWVLTAITAVILRNGYQELLKATTEGQTSADMTSVPASQTSRPAWWPSVAR